MNNRAGPSPRQPQVGATFYPGGNDDFYIPELISPLPQRSMPEVPENIQQNLAKLELESSNRRSGPLYSAPMNGSYPQDDRSHGQQPPGTNHQQGFGSTAYGGGGQGHFHQTEIPSQSQFQYNAAPVPSPSPFPPILDRAANVPPSDEEKEVILEQAREAVLNSNDPEMQLTWAQDALAHVEVAMQNEQRVSENQEPRPRTPNVEVQLRADAINVVSFLADQHHPKAEFMKGMWLEFGKFGTPIDKKEAYRCYSRAAQAGYARAEYRMGMQFESSNEIEKAIRHYSLGVEAGDSASNYRLGMMTLLGQQGQRQDYYRGIELIRFSAETADENAPQGAYVYGMLQARELPQVSVPDMFLPLNIESALYNIEKAAYLGFAKAQTKMGSAYELCQLGCQFDPALSLHYNNLAARQGEPEAEMAISKWFLCGYEGIFPKSESLAFIYAQRAAQTGLATAEFAMGYFYEIGIHVPVNLKEARTWYERAAEHGNKDAGARVDGISRSKTLSRKDHEQIAVATLDSARRTGQRATARPVRADLAANNPASSQPAHADHRPYPQPALGPPNPVSPYVSPLLASSALFDANLDHRPNSTSALGNMPVGGRYGSHPSSQPGAQRPASSMAAPGNGGGRGGLGQGNFYPQGQRHASVGMPSNHGPARPGYVSSHTAPPNVDIGFMAPPDLSGADRQQRSQYSDNPNLGHGRPQPGRVQNIRPDRVSSRPAGTPNSQIYNNNGRVGSPHISPENFSRPPRNASIPGRPGGGPHPTHSPTPASSEFGGNSLAPSANSRPAKPPKGPATFEEMGVPATKKNDDCIVM